MLYVLIALSTFYVVATYKSYVYDKIELFRVHFVEEVSDLNNHLKISFLNIKKNHILIKQRPPSPPEEIVSPTTPEPIDIVKVAPEIPKVGNVFEYLEGSKRQRIKRKRKKDIITEEVNYIILRR